MSDDDDAFGIHHDRLAPAVVFDGGPDRINRARAPLPGVLGIVLGPIDWPDLDVELAFAQIHWIVSPWGAGSCVFRSLGCDRIAIRSSSSAGGFSMESLVRDTGDSPNSEQNAFRSIHAALPCATAGCGLTLLTTSLFVSGSTIRLATSGPCFWTVS